MQDRLSRAENHAVVVGVPDEQSAGEAGRGERAQPVLRPYDASRVAQVSTDPLHVLERVFRDFAKLLTRNVRATIGAPFEASVGPFRHTRWDEFVSSIPDTSTICIFTAPPALPRAVWQIDDPTMYVILASMVGGRTANTPSRSMTDLELRLFRGFTEETLGVFAQAWAQITLLRPSVVEIGSLNQSLDLFPDHEPMMHIQLEMRTGDVEGTANACMATAVLQRLLSEHAVSAGAFPEPLPLHETPFQDTAGRAEIPITAEIGRTTVSVGAVAALAPGDVIRLSKHYSEPLVVYVAGRPKLRGTMGVYRGHMAVRITGAVC